MATKATYLTWDIMADFVLSDEFNTQLDPRNRNLKSLVEARMRTVVLVCLPFSSSIPKALRILKFISTVVCLG